MALEEQYNFEDLKNEAERLVLDELEVQLAAAPREICRTEECVLDMAAYALNLVKPIYRVTLLGRVYTAHLDEKYMQQVHDAVARAIQKISSNPA
ncbi:MAG TPA: late competence development ComFB family protein [Spirochaetia bacterium]|nr:late competence development ComFB family protein [Spirochaetia bacterium]